VLLSLSKASLRCSKSPLPSKLLVLLFLVFTACGKVDLYSDLPEQEVNEMLAVLLSEGIKSSKFSGKDKTYGIKVGSSQVEQSILLLKSKGYPKRIYSGLSDIFAKSGVVSSTFEQEARYTYALTQELAETLSQIDGVIAARVHVALGEQSVGKPSHKAAASAFVKYDPSFDVEALKPQIKDLIANSVAGLNYDDIAVVLVASQLVAPSIVNNPSSPRRWLLPGLAGLVAVSLVANLALWFRRRSRN